MATFKERTRYRFDNFMAKGGKSIFISLFVVFLLGLLFVASIRLGIFGVAQGGDERESGFFNHIYITFLQMTDPGNMAQDIKSTAGYKIAAILAGAVGVVIFSMLIGLITTSLDLKLAALRKGHSRVIENKHTLILGWNDQRIVEILRELVMANESEDNPSVVILADKDKEEMDEYLALISPDTENTRVITRSGSPSSIANLKIAAVDKCRSVIVLGTATDASSADDKATSDARVIKTIMAITSAREEADELNVVAEIFDDQRRDIIQDNCPFKISVVDSADILAKIMVQTSRSVGLSTVYSELLSFDGCEMYFHGDPTWGGRTFEELSYHFPDGVPMGIRTSDDEIILRPDSDRVVMADDEILIVADDDSTIEFKKKPVAAPTGSLSIPQKRLEQRVEQELFIGWNPKGKIMVSEYAEYVTAGSKIDVITSEVTPETRADIEELNAEIDTLELRLIEANPLLVENLAALHPETRDNIILLSEAGKNADPEEVDSRTVMILLQLRRIFRDTTGKDEASRKSQLITEVMDSSNQALVSSAGVKDFIISDRFISMLLAQMSEEAEIKRVYDDLFQEDGSEIYLKPLSLYQENLPVDLSFADCMALAQLRDEICIGIKLYADEGDHSRNYGVTLIPEKNERFTFGPHDCLVVLAEDET